MHISGGGGGDIGGGGDGSRRTCKAQRRLSTFVTKKNMIAPQYFFKLINKTSPFIFSFKFQNSL